MISANLKRRQLDPSQRMCIGAEIKPMFAAEARLRQVAGKKNLQANLPEGVSAPQSRDLAASVVGVSGRGVSYAEELKRDNPEVFERVKSGELTINAARRELRKQEHSVPACCAITHSDLRRAQRDES